MHPIARWPLVLALAALPFASARAQCAIARLVPDDGASMDFFGDAIALHGDLAFVGAPFRDSAGLVDSGAVYVYARAGAEWQPVAILTPSDQEAGERFGDAVSVSGTALLVGAPGDVVGGEPTGAAYVFARQSGGWVEVAKLRAGDPRPYSSYARRLTLDGDTAVVGALAAPGAQDACGAAYVYEWDGSAWTQTAKLFDPSNQDPHQDFGADVALSGDTLFIGAPFDGPSYGATYVYERVGGAWILDEILRSSDGDHIQFFGYAVAVDGDHAIVSATGTNDQLSKVYFYERAGTGWTEVEKHRPATKDPGEWFGWSVAILGDRAAVGARLDDQHGRAYVYRRTRDGWALDVAIEDEHGAPDALFGQHVELDGDRLAVGGPKDAPSSGSASIFDLTTGYARSYCVATPNSSGFPSTITFTGSLSIGHNSASLLAFNAPPSQFGVFFYGGAAAQIPFGDGWRCVSPGSSGLWRLDPPLAIDAAGTVERVLDFTSPPLGEGGGAVPPGEARYFQLWFRDPMAGGSGFNTSDALEIVFCP